MSTSIEWTDETWNPLSGCSKVSPGCDHCYAETIAHRFAGTTAYPDGFTVTLRPERLGQPLRWTRPRMVFVNSMSDLFHDDVPDDYIVDVFAVMAMARRHTFQVLTKRHGRMRSLLSDPGFSSELRERIGIVKYPDVPTAAWPLPNVWLGVSTENHQWASIRIPTLLDTPAAVRFISAEPLLGGINLCACTGLDNRACPLHADHAHLDWVIVGGESGPRARPMHLNWARGLRDQCVAAGVPFLFKQHGQWSPAAPLDAASRADYRNAHTIADDGTLYAPGDLAYPDGPRYREALRAGHNRAHLHTTFRVGKKAAGRELDGRLWDQYPAALHPRPAAARSTR